MSSPIEKQFAEALMRLAPDPSAITFEQYPSSDSRLRIDFAMPSVKRGVELDGFTYHEGQGREKATADKARERELDRLGWKITRFSGDEVRANADACAREWLELCGIRPKQMLSATVRALQPHQPSVYLAGKIEKNGWRSGLVRELDFCAGGDALTPWARRRASIGSLCYTGPFFINDDHGCAHGPCSHGWVGNSDIGAQCSSSEDSRTQTHAWVADQCLRAINRADVVIAWLDDPTAYGTIAELGYARGIRKHTIILTPEPPEVEEGHYEAGGNRYETYTLAAEVAENSHGQVNYVDRRLAGSVADLWFVLELADEVVQCQNPVEWLLKFAQEYAGATAVPPKETSPRLLNPRGVVVESSRNEWLKNMSPEYLAKLKERL